MKVKLPILAIGVAFLLSGCSSSQIGSRAHLVDVQNSLLSQGKPQAYIDGYVDGCSSGRKLAGDKKFAYRKDDARAEQDALYAKGWQDGQINCRNQALIEYQNGKLNTADHDGPELLGNRHRKAEEAEMRAIWEEIKK